MIIPQAIGPGVDPGQAYFPTVSGDCFRFACTVTDWTGTNPVVGDQVAFVAQPLPHGSCGSLSTATVATVDALEHTAYRTRPGQRTALP